MNVPVPPDRTLFYEDLTYGRRFLAGPRTVGEDELQRFAEVSGDHNPLHLDRAYAAKTRFGQRVVHGPLGIALAMGFHHDLGILERSALALLDVTWQFHAPIFVDDQISFEMTVTSRRLSRKGDTGVVGRHILLRKQDGTIAQEGTMGLLVRVADPARAQREDAERPSPGTVAWGEALAAALNENDDFRREATAFDGAIGLQVGDDLVALKVFEGRVLRVAARIPTGVTFSVAASPATWVDFLTRERNEFTAMATHGAFRAAGNVYEYLRLARALQTILDEARRLA